MPPRRSLSTPDRSSSERATSERPRPQSLDVQVGGRTLTVSNAGRVLFPEDGITEGELARYYAAIAPVMLPHVRGRPVTMQRRRGHGTEPFYQKAIPAYFPDWVARATVGKERGSITMVVVENEETLVYLADQASITVHVWLSRVDRPHHPDQLIVDLDPPEGGFDLARGAARLLRDLLAELELTGFVKTTGGKGLHVVVPLDGSADYGEVRPFAEMLAEVLVARDPERLTVEVRKAKRRRRLFVDVMRNGYGAMAVAPYALRTRPGALVATPIEWRELDRVVPERFTIRTVPARVRRIGDPWRDMHRHAQSLTRARPRLEALHAATGSA